jgi:hypothetical protein
LNDIALSSLRDRLSGLVGSTLSDEDIVRLVADVLRSGGSVSFEVDDTRFKLLKRESRLMLKRDDPRRPSTMPPKR